MGGALYRTGQYAQAKQAFDKGLPLSPKNGTAWAFLGLTEIALGENKQALTDIEKGEQLGLGANVEFQTAVRVQAALVLIHESYFDRAMAQLQPLTKFHVNTPAVTETVGLAALAETQPFAGLSEQRRKAVELAGQAVWAATSQRPEDAAAGFQKLLAAFPNESGVHYTYGLYLMESDQSRALEEFQKELAANPRHWPSLLVAAHLQTLRGSPDQAIHSAEEAAKFAPANYRWLSDAEIGRALLAMNQPEKAIPRFQSAIALQPDNAQTHFYLEQAYRLAGRKADAQKERAEFNRLKSIEDPLSLPPGLVNSTQR